MFLDEKRRGNPKSEEREKREEQRLGRREIGGSDLIRSKDGLPLGRVE
jgi:hypothetical protein